MKARHFVLIALLVYTIIFFAGWRFIEPGFQISFLIFISSVATIGTIVLSIWFLNKKASEKLNEISKENENHYRQLEAFFSINQLLEIEKPLPPFRGWAISPDFAVLVLKEYLNRKPKQILELGSGISSILLGYAIKQQGIGKVITLEHNKEYAIKTTKLLKQHNLSEYVTILHADLIEYTINGEDWKWYDLSKLDENFKIGLLIVDGPPYQLQSNSRYPAMQLLNKFIPKGGTLLVDDCRRDEDLEVVQKWLTEFPSYSGNWIESEKGAYKLVKN